MRAGWRVLRGWGTLCRSMNAEIPVNRFRKQCGFAADGTPFATLSGRVAARIATALAPTGEECRGLILALRRRLGCSRGHLAAMLGVPLGTLRRWEEGARQPSGAAKRVIWLLHGLLCEPERPRNPMSFLSWGRCPAAGAAAAGSGPVDGAGPVGVLSAGVVVDDDVLHRLAAQLLAVMDSPRPAKERIAAGRAVNLAVMAGAGLSEQCLKRWCSENLAQDKH